MNTGSVDKQIDRYKEQQRRIAELEEALRPFAGHSVRLIASDGPVIIKDDCGTFYSGSITVEHFRHAYEVLNK